MPSVTYRMLTVDDSELFQQMRIRAIKEAPGAFLESYEEVIGKPAEQFKKYFENGWIAGAFVDGELKGITGLYRHKGVRIEHKGTVWGVFVAPEARGLGCGRQMIKMLVESAKQAGIELVMLSTDANNKVTVGLYESLGFAPYGVEKHMVKVDDRYIDEVLMMRFL